VIPVGLALVGSPAFGAGDHGLVWVGDLLFLGDGVLWAFFTVLARRWQIDPVRATAAVWVLALAYLPIYFAFAGSRLLAAPRGEVVFQALYQGVGVAIVALGLFSWAVRVLGPSFASLLMPLLPVFGVLLAAPVLGEIPTPLQVCGMLTVSLGMAMAALAGHGSRGAPASRKALDANQ
jgi:drug/metabolite transporter (DMT)-like permease